MGLKQATMFIPTNITVGYNKRNDHSIYQDNLCNKCNDKSNDNCKKCDYHKSHSYLLAFVTYKNDKGELKQPKSFENWIDKDIALSEFDNVPLEGFKIQQTVKRSSDWFGSGANKWRILDPRGFYVEISSDNLLALIDNVHIIDRTIQDKCIYAWSGKTLSLIPITTDIYQNAVKTTELVSLSESFKNVKIGDTIILKDASFTEAIYLGKVYVLRIKDHKTYDTRDDYTDFLYKTQYLIYNIKYEKYEYVDNALKVCKILSSNENLNINEYIENLNKTYLRNKNKINLYNSIYNDTDDILYISVNPFTYSDIKIENIPINISNMSINLRKDNSYNNKFLGYEYDNHINFIIKSQLYMLGKKDDKYMLLNRNISCNIDKSVFKIADENYSIYNFNKRDIELKHIYNFDNYEYSVYFIVINNTNIYINYGDINYMLQS